MGAWNGPKLEQMRAAKPDLPGRSNRSSSSASSASPFPAPGEAPGCFPPSSSSSVTITGGRAAGDESGAAIVSPGATLGRHRHRWRPRVNAPARTHLARGFPPGRGDSRGESSPGSPRHAHRVRQSTAPRRHPQAARTGAGKPVMNIRHTLPMCESLPSRQRTDSVAAALAAEVLASFALSRKLKLSKS